ncbi:hypothetical protein GQ55_2G085100 [Panicum hallii var. hallii]|uniref:Uncharacterized protein n=1 Tax=Panicum hallii var. hallii TaxID=1504633 RepID=A0A2T7EMS8_9POAL|nr:hypothetical protein GQ55_2G085100 [Panicum hallii var. hallii]
MRFDHSSISLSNVVGYPWASTLEDIRIGIRALYCVMASNLQLSLQLRS